MIRNKGSNHHRCGLGEASEGIFHLLLVEMKKRRERCVYARATSCFCLTSLTYFRFYGILQSTVAVRCFITPKNELEVMGMFEEYLFPSSHQDFSMKPLLLLLSSVLVMLSSAVAQSTASQHEIDGHTSHAVKAVASKANDVGICTLVFDATGHVQTAVMTKSTGSKMLDEKTVAFALQNVTGRPNTTMPLPITFKHTPGTPASTDVWASTPNPPYPYKARVNHEEGSGVVKVVFDEKGNALSAAITKSTGSEVLDNNTVRYVVSAWKTTGGKKLTASFPRSGLINGVCGSLAPWPEEKN